MINNHPFELSHSGEEYLYTSCFRLGSPGWISPQFSTLLTGLLGSTIGIYIVAYCSTPQLRKPRKLDRRATACSLSPSHAKLSFGHAKLVRTNKLVGIRVRFCWGRLLRFASWGVCPCWIGHHIRPGREVALSYLSLVRAQSGFDLGRVERALVVLLPSNFCRSKLDEHQWTNNYSQE